MDLKKQLIGWKVISHVAILAMDLRRCQVDSETLTPTDEIYLMAGPTGTRYAACGACKDAIA